MGKGEKERGAKILGIVIQFILYRRKEWVKKYQKRLCSKLEFWVKSKKKKNGYRIEKVLFSKVNFLGKGEGRMVVL